MNVPVPIDGLTRYRMTIWVDYAALTLWAAAVVGASAVFSARMLTLWQKRDGGWTETR